MCGLAFAVQVEWPEQSPSQQLPGSWDPLAVHAESAERLADEPKKDVSTPLSDQVCILMSVGGAAAALAVAVGFAWLNMQ